MGILGRGGGGGGGRGAICYSTVLFQVMEEKVRRLEKKLKEANEKLKSVQIEAAVPSPGTEGKDARGMSLKDDATKKNTDTNGVKKKLDDLQGKYDKLFKETEELRNPASMKNRIPKVPKDYTPKMTLMKWVTELEAECGKSH